MQSFTFVGATRINAQGRMLFYEAMSRQGLDDEVTLFADGRSVGKFKAGDTVRLNSDVGTWEVLPTHPEQAGRVVIGDGSISRSNTGARLDASVQRVLEGRMYQGVVGHTATAAKFGCVAVAAISGSVCIRRFGVFNATASSGWRLYYCTGYPTAVTSFVQPVNRRPALGATPDALVLTFDSDLSTNVVAAGVTVQQVFGLQWRAGNAEWSPQLPIVIDEGSMLVALCTVAANSCNLVADLELMPTSKDAPLSL